MKVYDPESGGGFYSIDAKELAESDPRFGPNIEKCGGIPAFPTIYERLEGGPKASPLHAHLESQAALSAWLEQLPWDQQVWTAGAALRAQSGHFQGMPEPKRSELLGTIEAFVRTKQATDGGFLTERHRPSPSANGRLLAGDALESDANATGLALSARAFLIEFLTGEPLPDPHPRAAELARALTGYIAPIAPRERSMTDLPAHPRVFATEPKWEALRAQVQTDPVSKALFAVLERRAAQAIESPAEAPILKGRRMLGSMRRSLERILDFAMVYRLTDDAVYLSKAREEMRALAEAPSWNPAHFLDVAEATTALAIGFDWLYAELSEAERNEFAAAIIEKGLRPSFDAPAGDLWWIETDNNWNQVCHAGMVIGALAVADREPDLARRVIDRARLNLPKAATAYAPDGAYAEGAMYWTYGTTYHVMLIDALARALGTTGGMDDFPGFLQSSEYLTQATAPSGDFYNYGDSSTGRTFSPALFWIADRLRSPRLLGQTLDALATLQNESKTPGFLNRFFPLSLLWWDPALLANQAEPFALSWQGAGENPVAFHRSAWGDPNAIFVGFKGGRATTNHAHMDAGSFILEADGVRWAVDPGMEEYPALEAAGVDLWSSGQDSGAGASSASDPTRTICCASTDARQSPTRRPPSPNTRPKRTSATRSSTSPRSIQKAYRPPAAASPSFPIAALSSRTSGRREPTPPGGCSNG